MTKKTVTQKVLHQLKNVELCFLPVDMRPRDLGTNLLQLAILIYLACRAHESKWRFFWRTYILNFFLERASVSNFMALQIKIISHRLWITLENCSRWHPPTPWKFLSFSPHPLGISIDHPLFPHYLCSVVYLQTFEMTFELLKTLLKHCKN